MAPVAALIISILLGGVAVALMGISPVEAFRVYFVDPLTNTTDLQEIVVKASPLVLIAVGLAFCYRANLWNIGAEGQFVIGGTVGGGIAILTHNGAYQSAWGGSWILPAMLLFGALGGMVYALIPAVLKVKLGVSEILTSLMLVYVAQLILDYLIRGPWRDPKGFNFPQSVPFDAEATLPLLLSSGRLHFGVIITLIVVVVAAIVFARTMFGYQVRVVGSSPNAARHGGFDSKRTIWATLMIGGAMAGLAGSLEFSGVLHKIDLGFPSGYGFTAIIVAFLGRLNPIGCLIAGIVLAVTYVGGQMAQTSVHIPNSTAGIFQAMMLFFILASDILVRYRVRLIPSVKAVA